jgi:hypothetical protein
VFFDAVGNKLKTFVENTEKRRKKKRRKKKLNASEKSLKPKA